MQAKFLMRQMASSARFLKAFDSATQQIEHNQSKLQPVHFIIDEKKYNFYFIHREQQNFDKVRTYRKTIFEGMGLNPHAPCLQIIGDSAPFDEHRIDFAKQFLFDALNKYHKHTILYGITGKPGDVNALVNEWLEQDNANQKRTLGNAVNIHTPMAIKNWRCSAGTIFNIAVVHPDALFGADVDLSDYLVPQYDDAPGESLGICLEGGVQSFLQSINMLRLEVPIIAVEKLRGRTNAAYKLNDNYPLFFSAAEFLNIIKQHVAQACVENRKTTQEDIEKIRDAYLYNPKVHGAYYFEQHKHLRLFANPNRHDYDTKMGLFANAFDKFFNYRIWEKLELLSVVNCEKALEQSVTKKSIAALLARNANLRQTDHQKKPAVQGDAPRANL